MSKIETTSKVSLKLAIRINLGKRGACLRRALDPGHSTQAPPPPNNPPRTAKPAYKWQSQIMPKSDLKPPTRMNPGMPDARAEPPTPPPPPSSHSPDRATSHSPDRAKGLNPNQ